MESARAVRGGACSPPTVRSRHPALAKARCVPGPVESGPAATLMDRGVHATGGPVSDQKTVVERYFDGFRRSDHTAILACLTEDVIWDLPGYKSLSGKAEFDQEIEGDAFEGRPLLKVERLVEEGNTVVAIGTGEGSLRAGGTHRFAFCTVLTFTGVLISRVESYVVAIP